MASFFEKLKKGMSLENVEQPEEEIATEKTEQKPKDKTPKSASRKKMEIKKIKIEPDLIKPEPALPEKKELEKLEEPPEPENKEEAESAPRKSLFKKIIKKEVSAEDSRRGFNLQNLAGEEGQLAVDVYQTDTELIIRSTIAGVKPEDLDISIESDTVLIRGNRTQSAESAEKNYFYQECYWGPFSRQIIMPEETDPSRAEASMKEGVLTIRIPKIERKKKRKIAVKG